MAFDFIKKVFTFGRKAEEEKAPPADGTPPAAPEQPALAPYVGIDEQPATEAPPQALPEAEILPPIREPDPVAGDALRAEVAPEPTSIPEPSGVETAPVPPSPPLEAERSPVAEAPPAAEILPPIRVAEPIPPPAIEAEIAPELPALPPVDARTQTAEPEPVAQPPEEPAPEAVEPPAPVVVEPPPVDAPQVAAPAPAEPVSAAPAVPDLPAEPVSVSEPAPVAVEPPSLEGVQTPVPAPVAATPAVPPAGKVTVAKKVEARVEPVAPAAPAPRPTWFQRMREGLARSSRELSSSIAGVFTKKKLDEDTLQDLEDVLIRADLGVETALRVTDTLASTRLGRDVSEAEVRTVMAQEIEKVLKPVALPLELDLSHKPHVILVVGVNGTGKTTTIGKLAAKLTAGGLKVMLAAGDTFRAAAIEQLKIWGERTRSPVISSKLGADAAGLAYDAFEKAKEAGSDVLIIDTAGRLQNKAELMAELEKIVRVLAKLDPEAPHTVLQTVDATTGQNALNQVEIFRNIAGVNGLVMTKLDGTARGGILVAIAAKHRLPVYFIGVGEQVDDLEPFSANDFARAIAGVQ
ncbi:MAG: signal recognition particle-docking protein FtsY [Mesorhizobium sp.]|nr:signal recognition particle-docking protein FtsY [Mesorhizobium sp.]MCO5161554.1 signal recognition particle-docking protein FtsY [Mesorhizobium sp.]